MATSCVMCTALNGDGTSCVVGCMYAPLVAQGVVSPMELSNLCYMFIPSYIHGFMTSAKPEERARVIRSFVYDYDKRMEDPIRGSTGVLDDLNQTLSELKTETRRLDAQIEALREEERALDAVLGEQVGPMDVCNIS